jgi:UPF0716 family protein affecting phage T7 exclusion
VQILFLLGAIAGPLIVLTIDISKSAVVGGIIGGPSALLVVLLAAVLGANRLETPGSHNQILFSAVRHSFSSLVC